MANYHDKMDLSKFTTHLSLQQEMRKGYIVGDNCDHFRAHSPFRWSDFIWNKWQVLFDIRKVMSKQIVRVCQGLKVLKYLTLGWVPAMPCLKSDALITPLTGSKTLTFLTVLCGNNDTTAQNLCVSEPSVIFFYWTAPPLPPQIRIAPANSRCLLFTRCRRSNVWSQASYSVTSQSLCLCGERTSLSQCYLPKYFLGILASTNRALIKTTVIWRMSPNLRNTI